MWEDEKTEGKENSRRFAVCCEHNSLVFSKETAEKNLTWFQLLWDNEGPAVSLNVAEQVERGEPSFIRGYLKQGAY